MVITNPEPDHYFNENGLLVFTEHYHLKRGYCCGMECKHCPYGHANVKANKNQPELTGNPKNKNDKNG